jgi:hypothetical protein
MKTTRPVKATASSSNLFASDAVQTTKNVQERKNLVDARYEALRSNPEARVFGGLRREAEMFVDQEGHAQ